MGKPQRYLVLMIGLCIFRGESRADEQAPAVEILRDRWGVPHIFAASEATGFFGLGYACAEDRILQMDLLRRRGSGRLAEVFGSQSLDSDREARIAGHAQHAVEALEHLPPDMRVWMLAYSAGVNAWITGHKEDVARRFEPLGVEPDLWTPADCIVLARGLLSLGSPFDEQAVAEYHRFQEMVFRDGEAEAAKAFRMVVDEEAAIVTEQEMARHKEVYERLKATPRMPGFTLQSAPGDGPKMSHAWAVSGRRSRTGKPILESDPQLALCSPPFFYEFHLAAGRIDARGLGLPGCPGLFIGFNRRIAWGASALGANSCAVFLDKLTGDGKRYLFEDRVLSFQRRLERIRVKGNPDAVQEVLQNHHGVVFNALADRQRAGEAYVLYDPQIQKHDTTVRALLGLMTANNWDEFRLALAHYYDPGIHVVYADVDGNIGYHTVVHRPLTSRSPRLALEGWTGRQEIKGRITLDEMPRLWNPEEGFVSHANNMPAGSWYPYDLGVGTGGNGHTSRSWRLRQLLEGDRQFDVEDFEALVHRDDINANIAALLPVARQVVKEDNVREPAVLQLLQSIEGWDLHAGTVDHFPAAHLLENTLTPYRRSGLQEVFGAGGGGATHLARAVKQAFDKNGETPRLPAVREYLVNWLRASAAMGNERSTRGEPASNQQIRSDLKPGTIRIPYQKTLPLGLPTVDASLDIISPPLHVLDMGTIWSQPGNFYTQIVDLSDLDNSRAMIAPGNSEDARNPLRAAGIELWVQGRNRPAPLSRDKIEQLGVTRVSLTALDYRGPHATPALTIDEPEPGMTFFPALPPAGSNGNDAASNGRNSRAEAPAQSQAKPILHRIDLHTRRDLQELLSHDGQPLPFVSAHRGGAQKGFPENCIATFENTLNHTFAILEIDTRRTLDGFLVLNHDASLERTTTGEGLIANMTLADLKSLRLRDTEGSITGFQISTLDEALQWARGKTVLVLDKKDVPVSLLISKIREHDAEAYTMIIVSSFKEVQACYAINPSIMMEVMIPSREKVAEFDATGVPWRNVAAFVGHIPPVDQNLYRLIHERGSICIVGSSRNLDRSVIEKKVEGIQSLAQEYRGFLERGADLIETDLPRELGPLLFPDAPASSANQRFFHCD